MTHSADHVLGVDGCRAGWVGVVLPADPQAAVEPVRAVLGATLSELAAQAGPVAAVGIDMPMHLADEPWPRPSDMAARTHLRPRQNTLFVVPPAAAYAAPTYAEACEIARELTGMAFSRQAWALRAKIAQLRDWRPGCGVWEVHPETSFSLLAGRVLLEPKSTWAGLELRRAALAEAGIVVPADIGEAGRAGPDDVLDAAAAAWTARRIVAGTARSFPDDPREKAQAIWA
jgi:predicted RNase H-like nuclease